MAHTTTRRRFLAVGASAALAGLAGCLGGERTAEETVTRTVDPADASGISIAGEIGDVVVRGDDRDDVSVEGIKRAGDEDALDQVSLSVERQDDAIDVAAENEHDGGGLFLPSVPPLIDLTVTVPADLRVTSADADTGDVDVQDVTGPTDVTANTGDIDLSDVSGDVTARTDTGDQRIARVDGIVTATADTGDVTVREATLDEATADTGDVTAEIQGLDEDARVATDTGDVDLTLPSSLDVGIEVSVDTGDITVRGLDGGTVETEDSYETSLGNGTRMLSVETNTGDVTLRVRD